MNMDAKIGAAHQDLDAFSQGGPSGSCRRNAGAATSAHRECVLEITMTRQESFKFLKLSLWRNNRRVLFIASQL